MPIVFEPILREYTEPFKRELLDKYFLGRSFDSLKSALSQKYEGDHTLSELFEVDSVIRTFIPENLPATIDDKITEVDILWKQHEEGENNISITLQGIPVLKARFLAN